MPRSDAVRPLMMTALAAALAGCTPPAPPTQATTPATTSKPAGDAQHDGHDHSRATMALADGSGKYHFWLTAHLSSKDGNELDVFSDDGEDKDPKPVALPVEKFTAKVKRAGDGKEFELTFEPAPKEERPKDEKPGTCSHFVAKAPWMAPTDGLTVTADVTLNARRYRPEWRAFVPAKHAHHAD